MSTLNEPKFKNLINKLFDDDHRTKGVIQNDIRGMAEDERKQLFDNPDYLEIYRKAKDVHLAVSPRTAKLLYILAVGINARYIVEFGTSFGISTLHLAAAVRDNGGGKVISSEFEPSKVTYATNNILEAGLSDIVEIREGDAIKTLTVNLPQKVDLFFLDGAKQLYLPLLSILEPYLRTGAMIIADNSNGSPEYLKYVQSNPQYTSTSFNDLEITLKNV